MIGRGRPLFVVISYDFWRRRFVGLTAAIGQTMLINHIPFTIAGVSAPGFFGVDSSFAPMVFLPIHVQPLFSREPAKETTQRFFNGNFYWVEMMGRLRPGATLAQAETILAGGFINTWGVPLSPPRKKPFCRNCGRRPGLVVSTRCEGNIQNRSTCSCPWWA